MKTLIKTLLLPCIALFVVGLMVIFCATGKRKAPAKITPIRIGNVEYRIPNSIDLEAIVEAWDVQNQVLLWRKTIYYSLKMPFAEDQGNFIKSVTNGPMKTELTIVNERGGGIHFGHDY